MISYPPLPPRSSHKLSSSPPSCSPPPSPSSDHISDSNSIDDIPSEPRLPPKPTDSQAFNLKDNHTTMKIPGSFEPYTSSDSEESTSPATTAETSESESDMIKAEEGRISVGGKTRGRARTRVPLGTEILNMTVVTDQGRRWRLRELERASSGSGKGRFGDRVCGWKWSW